MEIDEEEESAQTSASSSNPGLSDHSLVVDGCMTVFVCQLPYRRSCSCPLHDSCAPIYRRR